MFLIVLLKSLTVLVDCFDVTDVFHDISNFFINICDVILDAAYNALNCQYPAGALIEA